MQVQSEEKPYDDINITPMLDLAYVLLVMFIIMTTAAVQGIKVDLPKASSSQNLAQPKTKVISVSNRGQMFLDTVPVSLAELEQKLLAQKAATPDFPVIVKADGSVQYERVMDILDLCARVGISAVGMAAQRKVEG
jgi:biopolymer transport protein ExbD